MVGNPIGFFCLPPTAKMGGWGNQALAKLVAKKHNDKASKAMPLEGE